MPRNVVARVPHMGHLHPHHSVPRSDDGSRAQRDWNACGFRLDTLWSSSLLIAWIRRTTRIVSSKTASRARARGLATRSRAPTDWRSWELFAQSEGTVDSLAREIGLSLAKTSQHLQAVRQAALVDRRKDGLFVSYRLAGAEVFELSKVGRHGDGPRRVLR